MVTSQLEWKHTDTITGRCPAVYKNKHIGHSLRYASIYARALTCDTSVKAKNLFFF